jgi:hypothetical protein
LPHPSGFSVHAEPSYAKATAGQANSFSTWSDEDFPRTASTFKIKRGEIRRVVLGEHKDVGVTRDSSKGYMTTIARMVGRPETGSVHMRMGAPLYFAEGLGYAEINEKFGSNAQLPK